MAATARNTRSQRSAEQAFIKCREKKTADMAYTTEKFFADIDDKNYNHRYGLARKYNKKPRKSLTYKALWFGLLAKKDIAFRRCLLCSVFSQKKTLPFGDVSFVRSSHKKRHCLSAMSPWGARTDSNRRHSEPQASCLIA